MCIRRCKCLRKNKFIKQILAWRNTVCSCNASWWQCWSITSCHGRMPRTDLAMNFSLHRLYLQSFKTGLSDVCRNGCRLRNIIFTRNLNFSPWNLTIIPFRTSLCFYYVSDIFWLAFSWVFFCNLNAIIS